MIIMLVNQNISLFINIYLRVICIEGGSLNYKDKVEYVGTT